MNGYWVVEVVEAGGETYFATRPFSEEARFSSEVEARDYAEEVLDDCEIVGVDARVSPVFVGGEIGE